MTQFIIHNMAPLMFVGLFVFLLLGYPSANATGYPSNKKTNSPTNMSGAMLWMMN